MPVDGGVSASVFFHGFMVSLADLRRTAGIKGKGHGRLYVIRNGEITPTWQQTDDKLMAIAGRAISKMSDAQTVGDFYRIYALARRDGLDFNLAYIPPDYVPHAKEMFDREEMNRLFAMGFGLAKDGYPWQKAPPGFLKPIRLDE